MHEVKTGVYVCHCGRNIADMVKIDEVVKFVKTLSNVVVARDYKYMCSDPGQELIKKDIKELGLNRVVVAACSPNLHESTFRNVCKEVGLNPFLFQMANIRELNSWVADSVEKATQKTKAFVKAAVERVKQHEELEIKKARINPNVLVIGGGIAGISASLVLAEAGIKVYLVEKEPTIGGHMAKFDKTFPTLDCAACILTPKMTAVKTHPNIRLLTYSEVTGVEGYIGKFKVKIKQKSRYINEKLCTGCYECIEECLFMEPIHSSEFEEGIGERKPIYIPFPQAVPPVPVIDPKTCVHFITGKCPRYCEEACETGAINLEMENETIEVEVGAIIVATGFKPFDASRIPQYGYGRYPNVYTSLQVERMLNSTGPTGGEVLLADGRKPESVGIIHCVGSRDENYNEYCSKVCCMYSIKLAHLIKERTNAEVYNFYIDIRAAGKGYEEFYKKVMNEGVNFIRGRVAEVTDRAKNLEEKGKLVVIVEDTLLGKIRRIPVDMVVLAVALEPRQDFEHVRNMLRIPCTKEGWLLERHPKLAPVSTATNGVYIAGACQGPKDIPDSVAQAEATAGEVLALIQKGEIELVPNMAFVSKERCSGCGACVATCPFGAIFLEKGIAVINETLCRGCGACVVACPSRALQQYLFRDEQIYAEIEGALL
jgi:heterodisulfide reductase subunit A